MELIHELEALAVIVIMVVAIAWIGCRLLFILQGPPKDWD